MQEYVIYRTGRASERANPDLYSAKHTCVASRKTLPLAESAAFGLIVLGGHGALRVPGKEPVYVEATSLYRSRQQPGGDELFVSAPAAASLQASCASFEALSFYQHFASDSNPEAAALMVPSFTPFDN